MADKEAKIRICLSEGKFEISGSEDFVSKQIDNLKELIIESAQKKNSQSKSVNKHIEVVNQAPITTDEENSITKDGKYSDIFVVDEEKIRIITDIPGNTASKQTLHAALIYAFAKKENGIDEANVDEIRSVCQNHAFLDLKNFSSHIKSGDPKLYLDKGSGKDRVIKLTRPGERKATELIDSILKDA